MAWAPIAAAGVSAAGSLLGGMLGSQGAQAASAQQFQNQEMLFDQQQAENWSMFNAQKDYNTQMANTAYQRSMADMKAAGLNPILAAGGNVTQAPTVSGSTASGPAAPPVANAGALMGQGVASASQAGQAYMQMNALEKQANKDETAADLNTKAGSATDAQTERTKAETDNTRLSADEIKARTRTQDSVYAANTGAAAASYAAAARDAAATVTEQHNARAAAAAADIKQYERDKQGQVGPPMTSEVGRTIYDAGRMGQAVANTIRNMFKGVDNPGTGLPAVKPPSAWSIFKGSK